MDNNGYNSSTHNGVGAFSNLQRDQVYKGKDSFGNNNVFGKDDVYGGKDAYASKNPYKSDDVYGKDEVLKPKYKRFSDLKILNENMLHMSNNTLDENSRIEILTQGEKGEIKNLLSYRIFKISIVPALTSLIFGILVAFTDSFMITLFGLLVYLGILVRTFFYPAKLYYENIKYKTTKPARAFFEEMDYWYKVSVVKVYVYLVIASVFLFILSFYQEEVVNAMINTFVVSPSALGATTIKNYIQGVEFTVGLKLLAIFNIFVLIAYSKFANKEKGKAEEDLRRRMRIIRNESLSRVQQIQADKN